MQNNNPYCITFYVFPAIFIFFKLCITNIRTHLFHTLSILYFIQFFELSRFFCFVLCPALARRAFQANGSSRCRWCAPPHCSTSKSINSAKTRSNFEFGLGKVANFCRVLGWQTNKSPIPTRTFELMIFPPFVVGDGLLPWRVCLHKK